MSLTDEFAARFDCGETPEQIAKATGYSLAYVRAHLRDAGRIQGRKRPKEAAQEARRQAAMERFKAGPQGVVSDRERMLAWLRANIVAALRKREHDARASGADELADEYMVAADEIERLTRG